MIELVWQNSNFLAKTPAIPANTSQVAHFVTPNLQHGGKQGKVGVSNDNNQSTDMQVRLSTSPTEAEPYLAYKIAPPSLSCSISFGTSVMLQPNTDYYVHCEATKADAMNGVTITLLGRDAA